MARFPRVGDEFGRYRIDAQIGQGGMGVVFGATDLSYDRRVALKVVSASLGDSPEFQRRFQREASLLARLNSPHIIDIFDYGVEDGCPYIATQYVGGGDLGGLIQARGAMPPQLAAQVCAQVADGLSDAHRAGVVHRDVKPSNVLLRDANTLDLHAYLCDFGIARTESDGLTQPGSVTGTWGYMAPECGKGEPGTPLSDVYALGCLLWVTLTGNAPYRGTDVEVAIAHQRSPIPRLEGGDQFTKQANQILERTMAKDPRKRYADADQLRAELLTAAGLHSSGISPVFQPPVSLQRSTHQTPSGGTGNGNTGGYIPPPVGSTSVRGFGDGKHGKRGTRRTGLIIGGAAVALALVAGATLVGTGILGGGGGGRGEEPGPGPATTSARKDKGGAISGDINKDGYGDLSVVVQTPDQKNDYPGELTTWLSDGSAFTERETVSIGQRVPIQHFLLGDFDGDEMGDKLKIVDESERPTTVTGELSGGDTIDQDITRPDLELPPDYLSGDVNGDGKDDLLTVRTTEDAITVDVAIFADSAFEAPVTALQLDPPDEDFSSPVSVVVGDFTGDGNADVATLKPSGDYDGDIGGYQVALKLYEGEASGDPSFVLGPEPVSLVGDIGAFAVAADVDGDEDDELLYSDENEEKIRTLQLFDYTEGEGLLPPVSNVAVFAPRLQSIRDTGLGVSDVNGDGLDDLVNVAVGTKKPRATVLVALSNGEAYDTAVEWGKWSAQAAPGLPPVVLGSLSRS